MKTIYFLFFGLQMFVLVLQLNIFLANDAIKFLNSKNFFQAYYQSSDYKELCRCKEKIIG